MMNRNGENRRLDRWLSNKKAYKQKFSCKSPNQAVPTTYNYNSCWFDSLSASIDTTCTHANKHTFTHTYRNTHTEKYTHTNTQYTLNEDFFFNEENIEVVQLKYLKFVLNGPLVLLPHLGLFLLHLLSQLLHAFLVALLFLSHQLIVLLLHFLQYFWGSLCSFSFHTLHCKEKQEGWWKYTRCCSLLLTCFLVTADVIVLPCLVQVSKIQLCLLF